MATFRRLIVLVASGVILAATWANLVSAVDSGPYTVKLEQVDAHDSPRVILFVTITDPASGEIVGGLTQDQFTVTEDSKPVEILDFSAGNLGPISTVLTIDRSGSMEVEGKMVGAKEAATAFVDLMRPQDKAALIVFNDTVNVMQNVTADQALLKQSIDAVTIGLGAQATSEMSDQGFDEEKLKRMAAKTGGTMHRPAVPPPAPTPAAPNGQWPPPVYAEPRIWQTPAPVCPTCQRPVRPGARFCTHCGTTLMPASPVPGAAAAACSR